MSEKPYNWIICEGQSEKIYFDYYFKTEIDTKKLRILPVGGYKEVKKIYTYLTIPIKDPDYTIKGKVYCLIDTDSEKLEVKEYVKDKNLIFERLLLKEDNSVLVEVNNASVSPPTEIEDCLNPRVFFHTLQEFVFDYPDLRLLFEKKDFEKEETYSSNFFDLTKKEKQIVKSFFDDKEGYNKILFAKKYVELIEYPFFADETELEWVNEIKKKMKI